MEHPRLMELVGGTKTAHKTSLCQSGRLLTTCVTWVPTCYIAGGFISTIGDKMLKSILEIALYSFMFVILYVRNWWVLQV